jgi:hypothetical protein
MEHFAIRDLDELPNASELRRIELPTAEPKKPVAGPAVGGGADPAADSRPAEAGPADPAAATAPAEAGDEAGGPEVPAGGERP